MNTSHFWSQLNWMFIEGLGILALPKVRLIFIVLVIVLFVSLAWQRPLDRKVWKRYYSLVFGQMFFYPAIIAIGVLYRASSSPTLHLAKVNPFVDSTLDVLFGLSLVSGLFWICRMRGLRWVAFCLVLLQQVLLFGAFFIAGMSVTGDWL